MSNKLFFCLPVRLCFETPSHFRFNFSVFAKSTVSNGNVPNSTISNDNAPSENLFVQFVTTRFNISSADVAKMLEKATSLGRLKTLGKVEQLVNMLNRHGFTEDQIAKIIRCKPQLLCSSERVAEPKIQMLNDSGVEGKNIVKIVTWCPMFLAGQLEDFPSKIKLLKTVFPTQDFLITAIMRNPYILTSSLQKTLEPSVTFWEDFGFRGMELTKFLLINLFVLTRSTLTPAQLDLIRKINIDKESRLYKYVVNVVACGRIEMLETKMEYLRLCGLSPAQALEVVRVYPQFFLHSEESIKKKMDFMLNHMKLSVDFVINHPRMLAMSLDKVMRPRFLVLQNMTAMTGAGKVNPTRLCGILKMTEDKFVDQIIKGHPESAARWTVYKNAIG